MQNIHQGKLLQKWLEDNKISVIEVSKILNRTRERVYRIFEQPFITSENINTLCAHYNIRAGYFFGQDDPAPIAPAVPIYESACDIEGKKTDTFYRIPMFSDCMFGLVVKGDAMSPVYNPGDVVMCGVGVNEAHLSGEAFLIIADTFTAIRYVDRPMEDNATHVTLRATNEKYSPTLIPINEIEKLFMVKGVIKRHTF